LEKINNNQVASLKISKDVISTIASVATLEIAGVAGFSEPNKIGFFAKGFTKPIEISLADDFAEISLCLDLEFGAKIPVVCTEVQNNVRENVQTMTGIVVSKVNITVSGIVFPNLDESEE